MNARAFFDTNTLVYILQGRDSSHGMALTRDEIETNRKGDITLRLLQSSLVVVGVQVFNELCNVAVRQKINWLTTKGMLASLQALSVDVVPVTLDVHRRGISLHEKYKFQFYDALMLAAALEAGCATFYSEDLRHHRVIEKVMQITNPFTVGQQSN
jgi:predicted nucleic acid-binding protein